MTVLLTLVLALLFFLPEGNCLTIFENINNSFEESETAPLNWSNYLTPGTKGEFGWDKTVFHGGQASIYLKNEGPNNAAWFTEVFVVGGLEYCLKVWAKVKNGKGKTQIAARGLNEKGEWIHGWFPESQTQDIFVTGTIEWKQLCFRIRVPPEATKIRLFLMNSGGSGDEVWFDDLEIEDYFWETITDLLPSIQKSLRTNWNNLKYKQEWESLAKNVENTITALNNIQEKMKQKLLPVAEKKLSGNRFMKLTTYNRG
ncbi:MAG: hypothetical protein NC913_01465 [Candidatus Omnitrophica bacterium]|nr:hypothetical protein [Candidatus Omnitrophota bacterium]